MKRNTSSSKKDEFCQIFVGTCTESAATTLTFTNKLEMGYSLGDSIALILHRIEYYMNQSIRSLILDDSDYIDMALVTSNQVGTIQAITSCVIDFVRIQRQKYGASASGWDESEPQWLKDYTNLPGGGLLVPPNPLYFAIKGTSIASAANYQYKFYYTPVTLNDKGFRELWETWNSLRV